MSRSILAVSLVVALVASAMPARADMFGLGNVKPGEMKYGAVELHPYVNLAETYDSNIFLQPRSKVTGQNANNNTDGPVLGSWIHSVGGGVKAAAQLAAEHRLDLAYDVVYKAYSKDPRSNNTVNQGADAMYTYSGPMGITGHAKDTYINTVDPATSELTQRTRRWENTAALDGMYAPEGGALAFGADAGETVDKYVSNPTLSAQLNRYTQLFGFKAGYQVMPKTRAYVAYHRQLIHYTDHPASPTKNSKANLVDVGIEGNIAPQLSGQIQTGIQNRKYDDAPFAGATRSINAWTVATKLAWKPLERSRVDLSLSRSLQEATFTNNQYYTASAAGLALAHTLPWKLVAGVNGSMEIDQYPRAATVGSVTTNRRDDVYQTGASLDYPIQDWLKAGVSYLYRARFSKQLSEQFNYRDHLTAVSVSAMF